MNQQTINHLVTVTDVAERISETPMEILGDLDADGYGTLANLIQELKTVIEWSKTGKRPPTEALISLGQRIRGGGSDDVVVMPSETLHPPIEDYFGGATYDHERDGARLKSQWMRVFYLMRDEKWRTLAEISAATGDPPASISARLRDLRKEKFGGHTVEREYLDRGLWRYRVLV